jgi:hypothetical protein
MPLYDYTRVSVPTLNATSQCGKVSNFLPFGELSAGIFPGDVVLFFHPQVW